MKIDHLVLGDYQTNSYVLRSGESTKDCLIIDTGLQPEPLIDFLTTNELNPIALILTHGHADHIAGIPPLRESFPDIKIYVHQLDSEMLSKPTRNLSMLAGVMLKTEPADFTLEDQQTIDTAGITLCVLHTPGHTPGGISLYCKEQNLVFTGDTLFADSVGRTDFPGGSMPQLVQSIKEKLLSLPDETAVYPGHGTATIIAQEKAYNQFLR